MIADLSLDDSKERTQVDTCKEDVEVCWSLECAMELNGKKKLIFSE